MELRASMARFSGPAEHAERRRAVMEAIARAAGSSCSATSRATSRHARLAVDRLDAIGSIAQVVPTEALATVLELPGRLDQLVADVGAVVRVIGRGEPATAATDATTDRLLRRCAGHSAGAVPVVSLLYQNFDATAALIGTTLVAAATNQAAVPAVPRTRRVAQRDVSVAGVVVTAGSELTLEIGTARLSFGTGAHRCPGQELAEQLVAAVVTAIGDAGYIVLSHEATFDDDGRPTYLPLVGEASRATGGA